MGALLGFVGGSVLMPLLVRAAPEARTGYALAGFALACLPGSAWPGGLARARTGRTACAPGHAPATSMARPVRRTLQVTLRNRPLCCWWAPWPGAPGPDAGAGRVGLLCGVPAARRQKRSAAFHGHLAAGGGRVAVRMEARGRWLGKSRTLRSGLLLCAAGLVALYFPAARPACGHGGAAGAYRPGHGGALDRAVLHGARHQTTGTCRQASAPRACTWALRAGGSWRAPWPRC